MSESRLIIGPKTSATCSAKCLFTSHHLTLPQFHHHYLLHVETITFDRNFNAPGVFPKHNIRVTSDIFPLTRTWYQVSVGPLLAKSSAELVFLSMVLGNVQTGTVSRVGLIRVSSLSAPEAFDGEQLGSPLWGEIEVGDLSKWKMWHQPALERHVRLAFPETHQPPAAAMYDYRTLSYVACVPALVGHLLQTDSSDSISPDTRIPSTSDGDADDGRIEEHRALDVTPRSVEDNPLMKFLSSAYAAALPETTAPVSSSAHIRPSIPTFDNRNASAFPPPSNQILPLVETRTPRAAPRRQFGGAPYDSIALILDRQRSSSHLQNGVGQTLMFSSVSDPLNARLFDAYLS